MALWPGMWCRIELHPTQGPKPKPWTLLPTDRPGPPPSDRPSRFPESPAHLNFFPHLLGPIACRNFTRNVTVENIRRTDP
jgi:hypothetical protein